MLSILLGILSSSGIGSILGLVGGLANRLLDQKDKAIDHTFELTKMDKEREYMKEEYTNKLQVSTVEAEGKVEAAGYEAMAESYKFAIPTPEDGIVYRISTVIRPLLTVLFFFFTVYIFYTINGLVDKAGITLDPKEVIDLWRQCIDWIFFQAGVCIGWWFAMRPGKTPNLGSK